MSHIPFRHQLTEADLNSRSPRVSNNDVESFKQRLHSLLCTSIHLPLFHYRHSSWHSESARCAVHNFTQAFLWIMVDKDGSIYVFSYGDCRMKVCQVGGVFNTSKNKSSSSIFALASRKICTSESCWLFLTGIFEHVASDTALRVVTWRSAHFHTCLFTSAHRRHVQISRESVYRSLSSLLRECHQCYRAVQSPSFVALAARLRTLVATFVRSQCENLSRGASKQI